MYIGDLTNDDMWSEPSTGYSRCTLHKAEATWKNLGEMWEIMREHIILGFWIDLYLVGVNSTMKQSVFKSVDD